MNDQDFKFSLFGLVLVVTGAMFVLRNFGVISEQMFQEFWPIVMIIVGFGIFIKKDIDRVASKKRK